MKKLIYFQRILRHQQTDAEALLWHYLKNRRFQGFKFRRQHQLKNYIVDFICLERNLVIELDGSQHITQVAYYNQRTKELITEGYHVLRFWNDDVLKNKDLFLERIYEELMG